MATTLITFFILAGIPSIDPIRANGQTKERTILPQKSGRDPFLLPPGAGTQGNLVVSGGCRQELLHRGTLPGLARGVFHFALEFSVGLDQPAGKAREFGCFQNSSGAGRHGFHRSGPAQSGLMVIRG